MYATPKKADPRYDPEEGAGVIPIVLHSDDGSTRDVDLRMTGDQLYLHLCILDRLIGDRARAGRERESA